MQELVIKMAQALVDSPEAVEVKVVEGESSLILELKVWVATNMLSIYFKIGLMLNT